MVGHSKGRTETFVIPVTGGNFAPEIIYLRRTIAAGEWQFSPVIELVVFVNSLPTSASIDVDILKPGGDPTNAADWFAPAFSFTTTGQQTSQPVFATGIRIRGKSGGTAGNAEIGVFFLY